MPRVALSFDDGPGPATPVLLDVLAARGAKATFFLLGRNIERAHAIAVRMAQEGHVLGNHTYSHQRPDAIAAPALVDEILRTDRLLADVYRDAGVTAPAPIPVRLPYGTVGEDPRLFALASLGRTHVHWTGDFKDWTDPPVDQLVAGMRAHIAQQHALGLNAVLDLHDSSKVYADRGNTVEAVRQLVADPGLSFFTVP